MKNLLLFIVLFVPIALNAQMSWDGTATQWKKGEGTSLNPYLIETAEQLAHLATTTNAGDSYEGKYFKLMNNLDLGGAPGDNRRQKWTPIGSNIKTPFKGIFIGDGNTIADIYVEYKKGGYDYAGLFGFVENAKIEGLGIVGNNETINAYRIGSIVGYATKSYISNCYNTGAVSSTLSYAGGIVGYATKSSISNCYNTGAVSSTLSYAGGIVGFSIDTTTISNCYNIGAIVAGKFAGGVVGQGKNDCSIINCYTLENKVTVIGDGDGNEDGMLKSAADMKTTEFITLLNDNQSSQPWVIIPNMNEGYPILNVPGKTIITVVAGAGGTVTGGGFYTNGSTVTLTATANTGHSFEMWSDNITINPRSVEVTADNATYTAKFTINKYTITVNAVANGSVTGGGVYNYDETATLTATANPGYHFVKWDDGDRNNQRTVKVEGDATYTAEFAIDGVIQYILTVTAGANGTVTGGGVYNYDETATLIATANTGYKFVKWDDGNTSNPRVFVVITSASYVAEFSTNAINTYKITVIAGINGTVTGGGVYASGEIATLTARANAGYKFVKWDDGNTDNPRTITVIGDKAYKAEFGINNKHTIIVVAAGTNGSVTGGGSYDHATTVILTATANAGYKFVKWNDDNTDNPRTITVMSDATYTAEFAINTCTITVSGEHGTVVGGGSYNYGSTAILAAIAANNYKFVKWSDGNTDNPRSVVVMADASYTAEFIINTHTITVSGEHGTVVGGGSYNYGSTAILAAIAANNYKFVKWSDGNTDNPRSVVVMADASYTAEFVINTYTITVNAENGVVVGGGTYTHGTIVILAAIANNDYQFVKWSDGNKDNPRTITVTSNASYMAEFVINGYVVTVNAGVGGIVTGGGTYSHGTTVTLEATANVGYRFVRWNDGNGQNPRSVMVTGRAIYMAEFAINTFTIKVNSDNGGTATGGGSYDYGTMVTLIATPYSGYRFTQWRDGNIESTRMVKVTENMTYTAEFAFNKYTITVTAGNGGTATGGGIYDHGTTATLTATANAGYKFVKWSDGRTDNPRNVVVTAAINYEAEFTINKYNITVTAGDGGTVAGGGMFDYNSTATLTATANTGYRFVKWSDGDAQNPRTITVTANTSYIAEFIVNSYAVTVTAGNGGTATGGGMFNYGETTGITATANAGYSFTKWSDGNIQNPRTVIVTAAAIYTANFTINKYTITVVAGNGGMVTGSGTFDYNTTTTITAVANAGYLFTQWSDGNTESSRIVTVVDNKIYTAEFTENRYTIMVIAGANGTVTGSGVFDHGAVATLTATANKGYKFIQWSDGNKDNPRMVAVTANATYTAEFAVSTYTITANGIHGTVVGGGTYNYSTAVTIAVIADADYKFIQWSDGNTDNPRIITVMSDATYTAICNPLVDVTEVESMTLKLYPNPVRNVLNVEGEYSSLEIYNSLGQVVLTAHGDANIDVSWLTSGVYVVKAYHEDRICTYKIVVSD